jgi:hypothetical protein
MSQLFHLPQAVRVDSTGAPYGGAKANFYLTGTTTRTNTYTNNARTIAHANPVVADSAGQFPPIYLDPAITYRCVITESDDTQLDDTDPYGSVLTGADIAVTDAGGYYAGTNVETVLADIGANYPKNADTETISAQWTFSGGAAFADSVVERPEMKDYSFTHNVLTQTTATITLDMSTGNSFFVVLTENATIAITNPPPTGKAGQLVVRIQQDGSGGAYTVTWPEGNGTSTALAHWAGGSKPVMTTSNDAIDKFTFTTDDAGLNYYGEFGQAYAYA